MRSPGPLPNVAGELPSLVSAMSTMLTSTNRDEFAGLFASTTPLDLWTARGLFNL